MKSNKEKNTALLIDDSEDGKGTGFEGTSLTKNETFTKRISLM
jgi:hypothetical protein